MIAIETKFHGPTNHRQARVSANCCLCNKRTSVILNNARGEQANHCLAADDHLEKQHRRFNAEYGSKLHVRVDEGFETREGYVFPLIPCDPY